MAIDVQEAGREFPGQLRDDSTEFWL